MKDKIIAQYGPEVETCADGITKENFKDVLLCIAGVLKVNGPDAWVEEQLAILAGMSLECAL